MEDKIKCLYFSVQIISPCDGVSKKVFAQKEAIEQLGYDTHIIFPQYNCGKYSLYANNEIICDNFYKGNSYTHIINYILKNKINIVYIRYVKCASWKFNNFLKKLKKNNVKIIIEIPTYPYDKEAQYTSLKEIYHIVEEKLFRKHLYKYIDRIVTFSNDKIIYNTKTINISNAPANNLILNPQNVINKKINFIAVANIAFWHGFDRLLYGLNIYYKQNPSDTVFVTIVGNGDKKIIQELKNIVEIHNLKKFVKFTGPLDGKELDKVFFNAHVAIGCLGCHRKNIDEVKSLKNIEYAMRGIPFIYSEKNNDFDNRPYVYKIPADESPVNINAICDFIKNIKLTPKEINHSVKDLTWYNQMKIVFNEINIK